MTASEESLMDGEDDSVDNISCKKVFEVHGCHVKLLQLCPCRNAASCTCVPDPRVPDTVFYRRDPSYDAEVIKGCSSMFAYRFPPRLKYVVEIREYACETCPGCKPTRDDTRRYHDCINLQTVKAVSYKGRGHRNLLRSARCIATGWVTHKIVPITTTTTSGGTLTLTHLNPY